MYPLYLFQDEKGKFTVLVLAISCETYLVLQFGCREQLFVATSGGVYQKSKTGN